MEWSSAASRPSINNSAVEHALAPEDSRRPGLDSRRAGGVIRNRRTDLKAPNL